MKKIAIYTLPGHFNYGNRLQNYALQQIIESMGFVVTTLEINPDISQKKIKKIKRHLKRIILHPFTVGQYFKRKEYGKDYDEMIKVKTPYLVPFSEKFISASKMNESELNNIDGEFDYFIVGSDQVWNATSVAPSYIFLQFASSGKRISYAASFGKSEINNADKSFLKKMIGGMDAISVRENAGKNIVETLTDKKAIVHVDPTMLLSKEEWLNMVKDSEEELVYKQPYILVYALRGMNKELEELLRQFADEKNLGIKYIMGDFNEKGMDVLTIPQFVKAINEAELMITDSFHGTVFSIIMNTPFMVLQRITGNMNSRIDTLLNKFDFEKNIENSAWSLDEILNKTDFSNVDDILKVEKEKSINYLKDVLI